MKALKNELNGVIVEVKSVIVYDHIKPGLLPVIERPPNLRPAKGEISVFMAAEEKSAPCIKVVDKAWRSKNIPSLAGARVGACLEDDERDRPLLLGEALGLLWESQRCKPCLREVKVGRIEYDGG